MPGNSATCSVDLGLDRAFIVLTGLALHMVAVLCTPRIPQGDDGLRPWSRAWAWLSTKLRCYAYLQHDQRLQRSAPGHVEVSISSHGCHAT